jgi:hypothetical protein
MDWLTVLELTAAALVVLGVLSSIAHFVNRARAKASATDSGKTRTVEPPSPVATPEPRRAPPPAAIATPPAADAVPPSESLLPPLEPIPPVSDPLPAVEASPPASKIGSVRFPRFAKPSAVPAARLKNTVRLKPTRSSKTKGRARGGNTASGRPIPPAPVPKAKPALTRRPKRVMQVRRKKIGTPLRRSGKPVAHRSPRPVLTPA